MRLKSVTLENYRVHRQLTLEFDHGLTLIGGPNEVGKSTLVEAIHRGLFLKAKGNTEHHRAMTSTLHSGPTEVTLELEQDGRTVRVRKRFGPTGKTTLSARGTQSLSGESAEQELARLLGAEPRLSGKAMLAQWSHLWVWQGFAGGDPTQDATAQKDALVGRLQEIGPSAILQSDLDAAVAAGFATQCGQIFTQGGKPRAGSDLERALAEVAAADGEAERARAREAELASAADEFESATRELKRGEAALEGLNAKHEKLEEKARRLAKLREEELRRQQAVDEATRRCEELESADEKIRRLEEATGHLEEELEPQNLRVATLEESAGNARSRADRAEQDYREAARGHRRARLRYDAMVAWNGTFELADRKAGLADRVCRIREKRGELEKLETAFATLPIVDETRLAELRKRETEVTRARATLNASATGISVVASECQVWIDGQPADVGSEQTLTRDADVLIGDRTRLRIRPGGGTTLSEARQACNDAESRLQKALQDLEVDSVDQAARAASERRQRAADLERSKATLEAMDPDATESELQRVGQQLNESRASARRKTEQAPDLEEPADAARAESDLVSLADELGGAESREHRCRVAWDEAKADLDHTLAQLEASRDAVREKNADLRQKQLDVNGLLQTHGNERTRREAIDQARVRRDSAVEGLQEIRQAIEGLQPELLESDRRRIQRAIETERSKQTDLTSRIAVARAKLASQGTDDPKSLRSSAEATARLKREHLAGVETRAEAIRLLDQLFREEQQSLAEQFTRPLAERVTAYLQCVFGNAAEATLKLEGQRFTGLQLTRSAGDHSTHGFAELSGGTREQVAAAVRLAMAEILAADHGGALPIIFDDAFAFTDPERIQQIHRMLDRAAERGLQVIVLTCDAANYAALGAKQHRLRPQTGPRAESENAGSPPGESV